MAAVFALIGLPIAFATLAVLMLTISHQIDLVVGGGLLACFALLFYALLSFAQHHEDDVS